MNRGQYSEKGEEPGTCTTVVARSIVRLMWLPKGDEASVHPIIYTLMGSHTG